jgi:hypothetical protein
MKDGPGATFSIRHSFKHTHLRYKRAAQLQIKETESVAALRRLKLNHLCGVKQEGLADFSTSGSLNENTA